MRMSTAMMSSLNDDIGAVPSCLSHVLFLLAPTRYYCISAHISSVSNIARHYCPRVLMCPPMAMKLLLSLSLCHYVITVVLHLCVCIHRSFLFCVTMRFPLCNHNTHTYTHTHTLTHSLSLSLSLSLSVQQMFVSLTCGSRMPAFDARTCQSICT
jgi:hypothetical protein